MKKRTSVLAKKVGMSNFFDDDGNYIPVTLLSIKDVHVVGKRTTEKDGYYAVILGIGNKKRPKNSLANFFQKQGVAPKQKLKEFRVDEGGLLDIGDRITSDHFVKGQYVDVSGITLGKGFAGCMKRHNFKGFPASHGCTLVHRSQGSIGCNQDPGHVIKGRKMPGQLGNKKATIHNLLVVYVNKEEDLIAVRGCVPGVDNSVVIIHDAVKKPLHKDAPFPAATEKDSANKMKNNNVEQQKDVIEEAEIQST